MYEDSEITKRKSNDEVYAFCCFGCWGICYATLIGTTLLSLACTWAFAQIYDSSETTHSFAAAVLTSIALCGSTFGACGFCTGGSQAKGGLGFLAECFKTCDDDDNGLCVCCRLLAVCGMGIIIVPSFGILQVRAF